MTLTTVPHRPIHGHYAIAQAKVTLHDGGIADLVDLEFDAGFWRRAHLAPEWLRLGPDLSGRWHVTLYFRTEQDGRLKERPYITALRRIQDTDPPFSWEAVGQLTQVDPGSDRATFRVRPDAPTVKPFLLRLTVSPVLAPRLSVKSQYRLAGTIRAERLLVERIDQVEEPA